MIIAGFRVDGDAVQVELGLVPAADDVETGAAVGDMVDRGDRLGRERRGDQRDMHGGEYGDPFGYRTERGAMGQGLERAAVDVGLALVAAPFRHRQNEFQPGIVGDPGHGDDIVPFRLPAFGREAHGQAAIAVGAEDTKLEAVAAEQRVRRVGHGAIIRTR